MPARAPRSQRSLPKGLALFGRFPEHEIAHVSLVVIISVDAGAGADVPVLAVSRPGEEARIRFQGLPAGYEFATVVDAIERVSRREHGLSEQTLLSLERLEDPLEVMVFATPT